MFVAGSALAVFGEVLQIILLLPLLIKTRSWREKAILVLALFPLVNLLLVLALVLLYLRYRTRRLREAAKERGEQAAMDTVQGAAQQPGGACRGRAAARPGAGDTRASTSAAPAAQGTLSTMLLRFAAYAYAERGRLAAAAGAAEPARDRGVRAADNGRGGERGGRRCAGSLGEVGYRAPGDRLDAGDGHGDCGTKPNADCHGEHAIAWLYSGLDADSEAEIHAYPNTAPGADGHPAAEAHAHADADPTRRLLGVPDPIGEQPDVRHYEGI
jgi:hypothetical protein